MIPSGNILAFYDFINEREQIRLNKEAGLPYPWTLDPYLGEYKFTNVRREYDWTSAQLIKTFYEPHRHAYRRSILMNAALFRYFGTFEFAQAVGWQNAENFNFSEIKGTASLRLKRGEKVFTGAYVITNQGISAPKQEVVVDIFLKGLHEKLDDIIKVRDETHSWEAVAKEMSSIPGFGGTGFMVKEILLDTMYTNFWADDTNPSCYPKDYHTWTPVGPGGKRGVARILGIGDPGKSPNVSKEKCLEVIMEIGQAQSKYWKHEGPLFPTDIQFQLCEFDKYQRLLLGQGRPRSKYRPRK